MTDRRRFLGGAAAGLGGLAIGLPAGAGRAEAAGHGSSAHPVIGTWRGQVRLPHEVEAALFTFLPGGFFLSFAQGIHLATGHWAATGRRTVTFALWQVLPDDLKGLPHRYHGEVQAIHHARLSGDTMTSEGTWRGLDIDGNETGRGSVRSSATRFGIRPF